LIFSKLIGFRKKGDFFQKQNEKKTVETELSPCIIQTYVVYLQSASKKGWKIGQTDLF